MVMSCNIGPNSHQYAYIFGSDVNDGVWRHVAWTMDSDGNWLVYLNGLPLRTFPSAAIPESMTRWYNYLGRSDWFWDPYLNGAIDEFYVFNFVLTAPEVTQLYQCKSEY